MVTKTPGRAPFSGFSSALPRRFRLPPLRRAPLPPIRPLSRASKGPTRWRWSSTPARQSAYRYRSSMSGSATTRSSGQRRVSPSQVLLSAGRPGTTQVNLRDEKGQIHTIDVMVFGDARALTALLNAKFPGASIKVRPVNSSALISGFVDRPEDLERIKTIAELFYPKTKDSESVIMNITVGGVQRDPAPPPGL